VYAKTLTVICRTVGQFGQFMWSFTLFSAQLGLSGDGLRVNLLGRPLGRLIPQSQFTTDFSQKEAQT